MICKLPIIFGCYRFCPEKNPPHSIPSYLLPMRMKASVGEALSLVLAEEPTITEHDMVNFIPGTLPIQPVPLLRRLLTFPAKLADQQKTGKRLEFQSRNCPTNTHLTATKIDDTYWPLDVCSRSVTSVLAPGHVQLFANNAYLNSSSQTTCSANFTCSLFSGLERNSLSNWSKMKKNYAKPTGRSARTVAHWGRSP